MRKPFLILNNLGAHPAIRFNLFLFKEKRKRIFSTIGAKKNAILTNCVFFDIESDTYLFFQER